MAAFLLLPLFYLPVISAQDLDGVRQLVHRCFPTLSRQIVFEQMPKADSIMDAFSLQTRNSMLYVSATSPSAAASGIYYYLREYCRTSISHNGDNLNIPKKLVEVPRKVTVNSQFSYRYALNYCTYSYSYPFYQWKDWERELDWMALHGINLMLAPLGMETIWEETLRTIGYTEKEIDAFIPGPAFTAWWLMGNLEGWGGVMSKTMRKQRVILQQHILSRMRELGIEPVIQGFYGMVPRSLAQKYPNAPIIKQGLWGSFERPSILLPNNELFEKMATAYYASLKRHYGENFKFLGGDLFHEGGNTEGVNVGLVAQKIQQNMLQHFSNATWLLQGWGNNPKQELLAGLDKSKTLVVNLAGEITATWEQTNEFFGTPWLWGSVNHFGGKTDMGGQLPVLINAPHRALAESKGLLKGIGILPEGIHSNPIVYDLGLKTAWGNPIPLDSLLRNYVCYRYGQWNEHIYRAWQKLSKSVYGEFKIKGEGTFESIFCARPDINIKNVSTWGPKQIQYNPQFLIDALVELRQAEKEMRQSETYRYDLVNLARQVVTNHARTVYEQSMHAFKAKEKTIFEQTKTVFLSLLQLQDKLLSTDKHFLLGNWLEQAKRYPVDPKDVPLTEMNARLLITIWGPYDSKTEVHDYANKEWSGLLSDFYLPRWQRFYQNLGRQIAGKTPKDIDYFAMERAWTEQTKAYATQPTDNYLACVDSVLSAVLPTYKNPFAKVEMRVDDLLGRMTLQEKIAQMRHIHFKHFNTNGQVDINKLSCSTARMSLGCVEAFPYSSEQYLKAMYQIQSYMRDSTRLGIPIIPVMEGLHGVVQDACTIFPQSIAQAATFNPQLVEEMGRHIAKEMNAIGAKQVLAPNLDLARELRWGRVEETYGEDPHLAGCMGEAYVRGIHSLRLIPTLKHFVAHGTPTAGLNLASVKGGRRELLDLYVKPFGYVIRKTAPLSVMNCYSSYDNEAVTSSAYYMTSLLRDSLRFKGYVYSDWGAIPMLQHFHHTAADAPEAARQAIKAGIDLEAGSNYYSHAEELVKQRKLSEADIDLAVRHILYAKFQSGLFDQSLPDTLQWQSQIHTSEAICTARFIAEESIVLLENKQCLPLNEAQLHNIAVIGPNADRVQFGDYSWSNDKKDGVTPLEGIRQLVGNQVKVNYAEGCDLYSQDETRIAEAVKLARKSDVVIVIVGTQSSLLARQSEPATSGEGYDLSDLRLPGVQEKLIQTVAQQGIPMIVVVVTGKPLVVGAFKEKCDALLIQWYGGEQSGAALADILFGKKNPSGKLPVSFPKSMGHLPAFYNYLPTDKGYYNQKGTLETPGRDYVFSDPYAEYPFGYGLSYSQFKYTDCDILQQQVSPQDTVRLLVKLTNMSAVQAKEVAQVYVRDLVSSVATPIKQLIAFQKVEMEPQESRIVTFELPVSEWALHDHNYQRMIESGGFEIQIGNSSQDILWRDTVVVGNIPSAAVPQAQSVQQPLGGSKKIKGTVRNIQAAVMQDVTITVQSTHVQTYTDKNGNYAIEVRLNDILVFEKKGYKPYSLRISPSAIYDIELVSDIE
ncbi:alpha-N-acetylglucosaminidase TIM-barrel domain-containing protein [Prevotella heparinolytica]|nr:alpha-N-acetylglucosaminidase TIM-barrel domain-containing protein [Bacteroides heparinolyticus]